MSDAKALASPKPKAAKPVKAQGDLRRVARILGRFLRSTRTTFLMAMLMLLAESGTSIAAKYPIAWLIDYLNKKPAPASLVGLGLSNVIFASLTSVLIFVTIAIVLIALLNSITDSLSEIYLSRGGRRLGFDLRAALFAHLQKLSLAFYSKQRTGDLLTRVTSDVSALETFSIDSLKDIASSIFLLILSMITLFTGSWQIALVALVMVPVLSVVSNYFADRIKTAAKKLRAREGELAASTQEMLTSIRVIQTYGSGGNQLKRFADISQQTVDTALYTARLQAWFGGVFNVLQAVTIVLVVLVGVWLIQGNPTLYTAGQLLVFVGIIQDMFKPTKRIIKQWNEVGKIIASVERISEVLDRQPAVEDAPTAAQAPRFQGFIEFKHVSFAYMPEPEDVKDGAAAPRLALRDVNFTVAPGEVVALVGGSGAGKSTIVQLLPRLYDPHIGTITFDGQDIRSYTLDSLRGQMSMVLQEAILFTGTVAENIAYGRQNATREEIIAAAMQASAHEFIEKLPDGYETMLSERAGNLSGGQRQRIAIARAFIRNTPILILDEPTTGLDAESTELVQLALKSLMRGKATVIISHDLNLIRQADTIIAIRDGAIEQVGSHRELLRRGGLYADLYSKQFGSVVAEQGGQMRADHAVAAPAKPSVPAILAGSAAQIDDDREEDEVVTPKAFQTLIGRALPAPVSEKVFQTLMMKVVPAGAAAPAQPAAPAPAAAPAQAAPGRSPREAQVLRPVPLPGAAAQSAPPPAAAPAQPAAPVAPPPVASPPAAAAPAQPAAPVVPPPVASPPAAQPVAPKVQPAAPVAPPPVAQPVASPPVAPPPAAQPVAPKVQPAAPVAPPAAAPAQPAAPVAPPAGPSAPPPAAATPEPAIFETTVVRAVPAAPAAATGRTEQYPVQPGYADGRSTMRIAEDELHDLRAGKAPQAGVRAGPSGLRGERLDLLHSPAFQSEFPGITTAFDAQAMREQIQSLLFGKARPNYVIEQCELDQATYLPGEGVALRYDLVAKDRVTLQTIKPRVIGMVCASQLSCALYMRDKLAPLVELMRGRPELTPFATPAAMIEPLNMILHVFPIDGELPALVPATDPQGMAEIFRETLPEALDNTFEIERCKVELVDYARRYRAVLRYYLDGRRPGSARAERRMVYGKLFHDNIGALAGPVTAALREHVLNDRSGFQFNVPRTLSWRPDMQLALLEAIPGEPPMSDELKARLRGTPVPASARSLEAMTESCARIAAVLHTSGIKLGRRRSLDDELAALRKGFAEIQRYSPELGERLNSWLELLSTYAEQSDALPATFCHGDFTHSQILFDGERPGLVDFDSICQAEPALDLGHFLAYLRVAALKARKLTPTAPSSTVEDLTERFLKTYAQAMGGRIDDAERLRVRVAVYQLVSLLRRALRSWQKFKGSRLEGALEIIEEEIACLPQLDY